MLEGKQSSLIPEVLVRRVSRILECEEANAEVLIASLMQSLELSPDSAVSFMLTLEILATDVPVLA